MSHLSCPITLSISSGPGEISSSQGVSAALFATVALHPDRGHWWGFYFIHLWESKSHACWWNSHVWVKKKAWPLVESLHAPFCCKNPSGFFAVSLFVLVESLYFALFPSLLLLVICQKVWWLVWSMFVLLTSSLCLLAGYSCWLIVSNMFSHHLWLIFDKTLTNGETK